MEKTGELRVYHVSYVSLDSYVCLHSIPLKSLMNVIAILVVQKQSDFTFDNTFFKLHFKILDIPIHHVFAVQWQPMIPLVQT